MRWDNTLLDKDSLGLVPMPSHPSITLYPMEMFAFTKPGMIEHGKLGWVEVEARQANHCDPVDSLGIWVWDVATLYWQRTAYFPCQPIPVVPGTWRTFQQPPNLR